MAEKAGAAKGGAIIEWSRLTRDLLEALAAGPVDHIVRRRLAGVAAERFAGGRREFTWAILKEEAGWKDRERARHARLALYESRSLDMVEAVVRLKIDELLDGIEAMTAHERISLRRRLFADPCARYGLTQGLAPS